MRKQLTAVCTVLVYVAAGGIVWWQTTEISRPTLPLEDMQSATRELSSSSASLPVTLTFYVVAGGAGGDAGAYFHSWLEDMHARLSKAMELDPKSPIQKLVLHLVLHTPQACEHYSSSGRSSAMCSPPPPPHLTPEEMDSQLSKMQQPAGVPLSAPGHYLLLLQPDARQLPGEDLLLVMGQHRHGWLRCPEAPGGTEAALGALLQGSGTLVSALMLSAGKSASSQLPLSAAGQVQLAFSLCNADPTPRPYSWDFNALEARYLTPLVAALSPVAQLAISSQVLHYTPAAVEPQWSAEHTCHVVAHDQLPFFVDSHWNLHTGGGAAFPPSPTAPSDSDPLPNTTSSAGGSRSTQGSQQGGGQEVGSHIPPHLLHYAVYIPPPQHRPLRVQLRNGSLSPTDSFWIPSWGGVIILNPNVDPSASAVAMAASQEMAAASVQLLSSADMHQVAQVAVAQLHALLGLPVHKPVPQPDGAAPVAAAAASSSSKAGAPKLRVAHLAATIDGVTTWQVEGLLRRRVAANLAAAATKLANLAGLVQDLPNLEMPQLIGDQVDRALRDLRTAYGHVAAGGYQAAAAAAQSARSHAEAAFFHPAVLAQFNFPESHKLGIYMPFFLPVGAALLRGLLRELGRVRALRCKAA